MQFGPFHLDQATGELLRDGERVRLQPQPIKVLTLLASSAGRLVTREELHAAIWGDDTFVDFEQSLNYCIAQIRTALGDDARVPRYVETLPRRGYRFVAPVEIPATADGSPGKVLLAVLPFDNMSDDPEQEYFSDGLTDEMITELGRVNPQRLGVIARSSSMRYKGLSPSIETIARDLGVGFILEGTVRRGADRVRVTAHLVDVRDRANIWTESYDRPIGDMLALQSELALAIAGAVRVMLPPDEAHDGAARTAIDAAAYELYLKGRYLWNRRSREALDEGARCFHEAIDRQPGYAAAHAGLADVYLTQLDYNYLQPRQAFLLANRAVLDALRLDDKLADAHTSLGHLRLHEFDWPAAEQEFRRAIALNPNHAPAHYYYGNLLMALGRINEANAEGRRVLALDPMSPNSQQNSAFLLYLSRRYDDALALCRKATAIDDGYPNTDYLMALIYERMGRYEDAVATLRQRWPSADEQGTTVSAALACIHAQAGRRVDALHVRNRLEDLAGREYVSPYDLALMYVALGERDVAVERLWRAHAEYSSYLPYVNVDARFDPVRSHPRFQALVARMRLPAPLR